MFFKQYYLGCLSHASYFIESKGQAIVIDPQRDIEQYLEEARSRNVKIAYIIETHLHADFVSGHRELAERSGATIVMSHRAGATFAHKAVHNGDELTVGSIHLRFFETPGHTPEGISILATNLDDASAPAKLFTGDTLFIGDVGRPDLSGGKGFTPAQMAEMLYDSLHEVILKLDDSTEVYPAHGAGSLCGRNMSKETWSTLGKQRAENDALKPMSKADFVTMVTSGLPEAPKYFSTDVQINRTGAPALSSIPKVPGMSPDEIRAEVQAGSLVLDVRPAEVYGPEHIPNSINIGLDGQFASWAGTMIGFHQPLIIVGQHDQETGETITRLARVGFTSVVGTLEGGIEAWKAAGYPTTHIPSISVQQFAEVAEHPGEAVLLDVRRNAEFDTGAAPNAVSIPLAEIDEHIATLDPARKTYVVCGSGYRSSIATSILEGHGFSDLINVEGGMTAYNAAKLPVVLPATA